MALPQTVTLDIGELGSLLAEAAAEGIRVERQGTVGDHTDFGIAYRLIERGFTAACNEKLPVRETP